MVNQEDFSRLIDLPVPINTAKLVKDKVLIKMLVFLLADKFLNFNSCFLAWFIWLEGLLEAAEAGRILLLISKMKTKNVHNLIVRAFM